MDDSRTNNDPKDTAEYTMEEEPELEGLPEYRIYAASEGSKPVLRRVLGDHELEKAIKLAQQFYPYDRLYVREVLEKVVMVIEPHSRR